MGSTHHKPAGVIFLVVGTISVFLAILSSAYSYSYFEDHLQLAQNGPLLILEIIMICTVLGLLGGLAIGMYVEAWRAKKGQLTPPYAR
jgi:hypothetical protein